MNKSICYLGLGTNIGDRRQNLKEAIFRISHNSKIKLLSSSSIYKTEPMYKKDQDYFYNSTLKIETVYEPEELLTICKKIEREMGRDFNQIKNGPRIIDIDIEYFADKIIDKEILQIPHHRIMERLFVLKPLSEIAKNFICPQSGKTIKKLLLDCPDKSYIISIGNLDITRNLEK